MPGHFRLLALLYLLFFGLCACTSSTKEPEPSVPNIIVIMADDQAQWASQVYGNQHLNTPNMLQLARQGALFHQAYAISPVCSPVRASFFTGKMPSQHGVHDFLSESPQYYYNWLDGEEFLSSMLKNSGYRTGLVGKWHATTNSAQVQRGFDYWFSYDVGPEGWQNQYKHSGQVHFSEQGEPVSYSGYQSEVLTNKALEFINSSQTTPFFLFMGFVDTHAPFSGQPESIVDPLRNKDLSQGIDTTSGAIPPRGPNNLIPDDHKEQLAQYYAGVEYMDQQIGRVLAHLRESDLLENTLIIYTSDHGHMNGHFGLYGKGNATRPQNFYQESIMVPLSITWPQRIPSGIELSQPVSTCDLFATILQAAGIEQVPDSIRGPGSSVLPIIDDPESPWTPYMYAELGNARMIANNQFKYIQRYPPLVDSLSAELYYLQNPSNERVNVVNHPNYQQSLEHLRSELEQFFSLYQTPEHSGTNLSAQPPANGNEQWRSPR